MEIIKSFFSFKGRITRLSFFISIIFFYIGLSFVRASIGGLEISGVSQDSSIAISRIISIFLLIFLLWVYWAQGAKRCHDMGHNGWYQLIPFYVIVMFFQEGQQGNNKFGEDPKAKY